MEPSRARAGLRLRRSWIGPGVVIAIALAVTVGFAISSEKHTSAPGGTPAATSLNPTDWVLPSLDGNGTLSLREFHGTPVVVAFFASWCNACNAELPDFALAARQAHGRVKFVGVNSQETGDGVAMAHQTGIDRWPLARDVNGAADSGLHDALGGTGMPITAFYDGNGRVLFVAPGALTPQELRDDLRRFYGSDLPTGTPQPQFSGTPDTPPATRSGPSPTFN